MKDRGIHNQDKILRIDQLLFSGRIFLVSITTEVTAIYIPLQMLEKPEMQIFPIYSNLHYNIYL